MNIDLQAHRDPGTLPLNLPATPSMPLSHSPRPEHHARPDNPHEHPDDRRLRLLFRSQLAELLRLHAGEWALVDDSGMVDTDVDKTCLLNRHHPANPHYFIIRRIVLDEQNKL